MFLLLYCKLFLVHGPIDYILLNDSSSFRHAKRLDRPYHAKRCRSCEHFDVRRSEAVSGGVSPYRADSGHSMDYMETMLTHPQHYLTHLSLFRFCSGKMRGSCDDVTYALQHGDRVNSRRLRSKCQSEVQPWVHHVHCH